MRAPQFTSWILWIPTSILELFAFLGALLLYPLGWSRRYCTSGEQGTGTPILLVHGYLHNASAWPYFLHHLRRHDHGPIYMLNLGHPFCSLHTYVEKVERKAQAIQTATGHSRLILIGHSMGGVVCSLYATTRAPRDSLQRIITIGSPVQGTHLAHIALSRCGRELIPGSPLLQELAHAARTRTDLSFHHITATKDVIAFPPRNTTFDTAHDHLIVHQLGHISLLYAPPVIRQVLLWLRDSKGV